jgi:hypothetical protein
MTSQVKPLEYLPWSTIAAAQQEAQRIGERRVGTDLLLLGLLREHDIEEILQVSLTDARAQLAALDNAALGALGLPEMVEVERYVDRPIPVRPSVRSLMQPRIRLTPAAKETLREASKPIRRGKQITRQRVLLALLENKEPDPAATLLSALKVDRNRVRTELETDGPTSERSS